MRASTLLKIAALAVAINGVACGPGADPQKNNADNATPNNVVANNSTTNGTPNNVATNNVATNNTATNGNTNNVMNNNGDCVPRRDAFDTNARPHIETYCSNCHGETPEFGAPMTLLDYDLLVDGAVGERYVDKMVTRLVEGSMPPAGSPRPLHNALDTLVEWASCGEQHADHSIGLQASAPLWEAPEEPPAGAESFDVVANEFAVSPTTLDLYQCFVVQAPIDEPRLIRRIDPVIDDGRVLHHSLVKIDRDRNDDGSTFSCFGFPPGEDYVYVWGPGQPSIEFPDGGLRIEPGDSFVLQIHYNNGAGVPDVQDSSGFRVWHEPVGGTEYGLYEIGPLVFPAIQPGGQGEAVSYCNVREEVNLVASWPHMHEIGSEFIQTVDRANGQTETIIQLSGWSFEAQLIYDTPVTLYPGDRLTTRCTFDNYKDFTVAPGLGTEDEMCFNFMYLEPSVARFCD